MAQRGRRAALPARGSALAARGRLSSPRRRRGSSGGCRSRVTSHPASRHVADLGLMVAARPPAPGDRQRAARADGRVGARQRGREARAPRLPHNEPAIALYEWFGFVQEGYRRAPLPPRRRIPGRDPDGLRHRHRVSGLVQHYGLIALFLIVMLESGGVPLPGETALVAAGVFASSGRLDIVAVIAVAAAAAIIGDNVGYWIGRTGGRSVLTRWRSHPARCPGPRASSSATGRRRSSSDASSRSCA